MRLIDVTLIYIQSAPVGWQSEYVQASNGGNINTIVETMTAFMCLWMLPFPALSAIPEAGTEPRSLASEVRAKPLTTPPGNYLF